ncbi:MAG: ATP-binding protein [Deltaproteobacteria bacterium]|nr:ATP-binding protein [Deltaproteobacteria bacterium]
MFSRILNLRELLKKRSFFLFGPRGTGKSTLIDATLPEARIYDLLDPVVFERLVRSPGLLSEESAGEQLIVIDEVQKLPSILDEVQRLITKRKVRFLLTGSSARKIRRGGANLLAGRAFEASLFPLVSNEIPEFNLLSYLNTTGLPEFYGDSLAEEYLQAYVGTYLKEEIQAEALTRNLPGFSRFLEVIALSNGQEINYASLASDCGIPVRTLQGYFSILNDTLLGFEVPPFLKTIKRKAITRSKYFLFDVGVVNHLARRGKIALKSELFGSAFEHFIALELRAWLSYTRRNDELRYWRSTSQFEVDYIIGTKLAIEVKGTDLVTDKHLRGLRALAEEGLIEQYVVVSLDANKRITDDGILILPWKIFCRELWENKIG